MLPRRCALIKPDPYLIGLWIIRTVETKCMRVSVGGGLGNKQRWKGVGAAGGHFKWPVMAAVTGPYTHTPREGSSCTDRHMTIMGSASRSLK